MSTPEDFPQYWQRLHPTDWNVSLKDRYWESPPPINLRTDPLEVNMGESEMVTDGSDSQVNLIDDEVHGEDGKETEVEGLVEEVVEKSEIFWDTGIPLLCQPTEGRLLVREEYKRAYAKIDSLCSAYKWKGVVFSGHSGIGKTIGLFVFLIWRLNGGKATIFSKGEDTIFFHAQGVFRLVDGGLHAIHAVAPQGTWALIDSDNLSSPPYYLVDASSPVFPIHAASHRPERYSRWKKQRRATMLLASSFTWSEILAGATLETGMTSTLHLKRRLRNAFMKYGPSARFIYEHIEAGGGGCCIQGHDDTCGCAKSVETSV